VQDREMLFSIEQASCEHAQLEIESFRGQCKQECHLANNFELRDKRHQHPSDV
jgi:hypothetical protein